MQLNFFNLTETGANILANLSPKATCIHKNSHIPEASKNPDKSVPDSLMLSVLFTLNSIPYFLFFLL